MNMSDEILSSRDTHGAGAARRGPDSLVNGKRVLLALGLWLFAAVVIGTATFFAARSSGAAAVTAIVVGEVYTLLIVALMIVFRPRTAQALGLVRCRRADVGLAFAACGGAYLIAAVVQSAVGPWPWSSSITILKAMGSDDGRLATVGPAVAGIIVIRACVLAALGEETLFRGVLYTWLRRLRRALRSPSLPRHMPRSMASLRFFPSLSLSGSASVGCVSDPVQPCQRSSFTRFTMPR
jgi:membrane protease YdiL (CAAX protease family)